MISGASAYLRTPDRSWACPEPQLNAMNSVDVPWSRHLLAFLAGHRGDAMQNDQTFDLGGAATKWSCTLFVRVGLTCEHALRLTSPFHVTCVHAACSNAPKAAWGSFAGNPAARNECARQGHKRSKKPFVALAVILAVISTKVAGTDENRTHPGRPTAPRRRF